MRIYLLVMMLPIFFSGCSDKDKDPLYLYASQPVEKRVNDLMNRMTLQEKVAQMSQYVGIEHMKAAEKDMTVEEMKKSHAKGFYPDLHSTELIEMTKQGLIGSFLHVITSEEANRLQSYAMQSRLKIPLLIGIDAIHGTGLYRGATIYPTPIGQAATFEPELAEKASRQTALEMRATGTHWAFTPNVEVARDARWGRVGETFGEDPFLVGQMGAATVRGLQTSDFTGQDKVLACTKHFIGGSQPVNGINGAPCDISDRTLHEVFMPPFKDCLDAGTYTFMMAHNELNGVPCHTSKYLMKDILRDAWKFNGFIVSDWMDNEHVHEKHCTAATLKDAYLQSVKNGMDMHMHGPEFADAVIELVNEKELPMSRVNDAVSKILTAKFKLGLFENPYIDEKKVSQVLFSAEHRETALEMARKSIVLLKNDNNLLPLDSDRYKKVFVTGPNADNQTILGDWAFEQPDSCVTTVIEGLRMVSPQTDFDFFPFATNLRTMEMSRVLQAKDRARKADLAIVVVGENSMRYMWKDKTCGEILSLSLMLLFLTKHFKHVLTYLIFVFSFDKALQIRVIFYPFHFIRDNLLDFLLDPVVIRLYFFLHPVVSVPVLEIYNLGQLLIVGCFPLHLLVIHHNLAMKYFLLYPFIETVADRTHKHTLCQTGYFTGRYQAIHLRTDRG